MTHIGTFGYELSRRRTPPSDIDLYRARAAALRNAAMRDGATLRLAGAGAVVLAAIVAAVVIFTASLSPQPQITTAAAHGVHTIVR